MKDSIPLFAFAIDALCFRLLEDEMTDQESKRRNALGELHYPLQWLTSGLLDEQLLQQQIDHYHATNDRNLEHYRHEAFREILAKCPALDDNLVARYVTLAGLDEDQVMAQSALADLLHSERLTDQQFIWLTRQPIFQSSGLERIARRQSLIRQLQRKGFTDDLITQVIDSGDAIVQRILLARSDISRGQMEALRDRAANRAIRNAASQRLRFDNYPTTEAPK